MPLPENEATNKTGKEVIETLKGAFHTPAGFRPAHARGILLKGTWTPTTEAASLSKAYHFNNSVPVTARFSNSTGIPQIPDNDSNASPRGLAVRFNLPNTSDGKRAHTDIVAHSSKFFPVRTGELFLALLQALGSGKAGEFLGEHPSAAAFVGDPKPNPVSFGTLPYFGVSAFTFTSADGKDTNVRYRWVPDAGEQTLSDEDAKARDPAYLHNEIQTRVVDGGVSFKLLVQVAETGDPTNDATVHWPEERKTVELGTLKLDGVVEDNDDAQRKIIFDPIPRIDGVKETDDPLFDMRASIYLQSGKDRRANPYDK
ncbi:Catalase-related peroxidase [Cyphellophora attinorum]|uniref:Catalase-related peroxidase n=1 Tax=Cyphellophora attinorum TaxID=1664694 RepID=A0A0N1H3H8_9EURO|nr:Catalase-related peroxidase [Phialophora attinorum]KPI34990.1 Catalase-related peroxidase [Phialophora attinorum]